MPDIDDFPLRKWPQDWDIHVARACRSYLQDNDDSQDVCFETATFIGSRISGESFDVDQSALRIVFKLKARRWLVYFTFDGEEHVTADIGYVIATLPVEDVIAKDFYTYPESECKMQTAIKMPVSIVVEKEVVVLINKVKEEIWADYWRRKGGGGDNDDDDNTSPGEDPSPSVKKTNLIGVSSG